MKSVLWAVSVGLLWSATVIAEVAPNTELARMDAALADASFHGVLVFSRDGQLDALRVRRDGAAAGGQELIERLTGPSLPLQRSERGAWIGEGPRYLVSGPVIAPAASPDRAVGYELLFVAEDRVAGRVAHVIDARARDALRYGRRFWVDRDSGVLLRTAVFGSDGIIVEQWMFASFELGKPAAEATMAAPPARQSIEFSAASAAHTEQTRMRVIDPPTGFQLVSAAVEDDNEQLVYSDGLAKVSVFVERLPTNDAVMSGLQQRGALSVFGRLFDGLQVVVVGEVPPSTAERFAQGVTRRDGS